jgi:hypothetical protein
MQDSETGFVGGGDIGVRTRVDLTAVQWLDKREACLLTNIHNPPQEGSFRSERDCNKTRHGGYNCYMVSVDKEDEWLIATHYPSDMEMDNKSVFPLVVSGRSEHFILLSSCGGKNISHRYL